MSAPDPSTSSYYVSDDFYAALVEDFSGWQTAERAISDDALRESCARFLAGEARAPGSGPARRVARLVRAGMRLLGAGDA